MPIVVRWSPPHSSKLSTLGYNPSCRTPASVLVPAEPATDATAHGPAFYWRVYSNICSKVVLWDRSKLPRCTRSMRAGPAR
jgi:hypothetical protein